MRPVCGWTQSGYPDGNRSWIVVVRTPPRWAVHPVKVEASRRRRKKPLGRAAAGGSPCSSRRSTSGDDEPLLDEPSRGALGVQRFPGGAEPEAPSSCITSARPRGVGRVVAVPVLGASGVAVGEAIRVCRVPFGGWTTGGEGRGQRCAMPLARRVDASSLPLTAARYPELRPRPTRRVERPSEGRREARSVCRCWARCGARSVLGARAKAGPPSPAAGLRPADVRGRTGEGRLVVRAAGAPATSMRVAELRPRRQFQWGRLRSDDGVHGPGPKSAPRPGGLILRAGRQAARRPPRSARGALVGLRQRGTRYRGRTATRVPCCHLGGQLLLALRPRPGRTPSWIESKPRGASAYEMAREVSASSWKWCIASQ